MTDVAPPQPAAKPGRPGVILFYVFLQSIASGLSVMPTIELFHQIKREECLQKAPAHIPEIDPCNIPMVYGPIVTTYFSIIAFLSLLVVGPVGRWMDARGRKTVIMAMAVSGLLNAAGDNWLYLCAAIPQLTATVYPAMLAAVFKGLGGASIIAQAAHWSLIATSSSPTRRSTYFSLALFTVWAASTLSVVGSALLARTESKALPFQLSFFIWIVYSLAAAGLLYREDEPSPSSNALSPLTSFHALVHGSLLDPVFLLFKNTTTGLIALSYAFAVVALNAFDGMLAMESQEFGYDGARNTLVILIVPTIRCLIALCLLPLFITIYQWRYKVQAPEVARPIAEPTETTPLLVNIDAETDATAAPRQQPASDDVMVWSQDILVTRWSFFAGAVGAALTLFSRSLEWYIIGASSTAFIVPAIVATASMATLKAQPSELGRTMIGFTLIDSAAMFLRLIPTIYAFNGRDIHLPAKPVLVATMLVMIGGSVVSWFVKRSVKSTSL